MKKRVYMEALCDICLNRWKVHGVQNGEFDFDFPALADCPKCGHPCNLQNIDFEQEAKDADEDLEDGDAFAGIT